MRVRERDEVATVSDTRDRFGLLVAVELFDAAEDKPRLELGDMRQACAAATAALGAYYDADEVLQESADLGAAVACAIGRRWAESGGNDRAWQIVWPIYDYPPWDESCHLWALRSDDDDQIRIVGDMTDTRDLTGCEDLHDCGHVLDERRRVDVGGVDTEQPRTITFDVGGEFWHYDTDRRALLAPSGMTAPVSDATHEKIMFELWVMAKLGRPSRLSLASSLWAELSPLEALEVAGEAYGPAVILNHVCEMHGWELGICWETKEEWAEAVRFLTTPSEDMRPEEIRFVGPVLVAAIELDPVACAAAFAVLNDAAPR